MLLSIDRVLQLLAEGKDVDKISELANCDKKDVATVIEEARNLLGKYEKPAAKKKIILKKKVTKRDDDSSAKDDEASLILDGAELGAIQLDSLLVFNTSAIVSDDEKSSAIGIQIMDHNNFQIGKVSFNVGRNDFNKANYYSIIRAIRIANYFNASSVRIRSSAREVVDQINEKDNISKPGEQRLYDQVKELLSKVKDCKIDFINEYQNDRAVFFATNALAEK